MRVSLIQIRRVSRQLAITRWAAGLLVFALVSTFTPCCEVYAASAVAHASSNHDHDDSTSHGAGPTGGPCGQSLENYPGSALLPQAAMLVQKLDIGTPFLTAIGVTPPLVSTPGPLHPAYHSIPPPDPAHLRDARLLL